ncbi:MAG: CPBP family intramembrane metalloprotease [Solobacterium sp.]|jgi:membrane protease YdiL (CAAX protease family)|nr:CPBP family intramembrane metalloprotease [Solobacterium sp.]MCH4204991.1 CPBP family intramembrane metalloprotease [Solobacterium sp.]MCH4226500.1 CPBP family intramembrane metalloprotease [Solobacterium sp.]MCH4281784.1 CPBP family intramembrane metalloprotease [Solobacterium sp.]
MRSKVLTKKKRKLLLLIYFVGYLFLFRWFLSGYVYPHFGQNGYLLVSALIDGAMLVFFVFTADDWLKEQWKIFCQRMLHSSACCIFYLLLLFGTSVLFSILIAMPLHLGQAENQINNETMMQLDRIGFLFDAVVMAPFAEEIIFRGCIFHPIAEKKGIWIGALVSGLFFGAMHIAASATSGNWMNLLYLIDYGSSGIILAYAFGRTDSIWTSIIVHACFNLIGICALL